MKKILLGLLVLVSFCASAQVGPIYKFPRVQVTRMPLGAMGDSVVVRNETTGELKFARRNPYHTQQQKYNSVFSLVDMSDSSLITKKHLLDAIEELEFEGGTATYLGGLMTNGGSDFSDPSNPDTTNWIATLFDVSLVNNRVDSIVGVLGSIESGVDSVTKVADSFRVWKAGVYTSLKDSIGDGGVGIPNVNRGSLLTGNGDDIELNADTSAGKLASQYMIKTVAVIADIGISVQEVTDGNGNKTYSVKNTGSPGSNPHNALDLRSYGAQSDATGSGTSGIPAGTDNTPFLQAAINAASSGQWIIAPAGAGGAGYAFKTALDTITGGTTSQNKKVYLLFLADVYLGKNDFIRIKNQAGDYEQHKIIFKGNVLGRTNEPAQNSTNYIAGTGPVWANYTTGVVVKIINCNQNYIEFSKVTATRAPVEIISFGGLGSQENVIIAQRFSANKYGFLGTSLDGEGFIDKNFLGGHGGARNLRIGGQYPVYLDGYSGAAGNGETYNCAFRSNEFHFLIENADELPVGNGDITEMWMDCTQEGGSTTGVLNPNAKWGMKITSPNYVRNPRYSGGGVYLANRLGTSSTGSMGVNGTIDLPIWSTGSTSYYGNSATIDGSGNIIINCPPSTSQTVRAAAPAYVKFKNVELDVDVASITASTYSVASSVNKVKMNNAAGTVTLPSPSSFPTRRITIFNLHANDLDIAGTLGSGVVNVILGNTSVTYWSDGAAWYSEGDGGSSAGGGSSIFTDDPNGYTTTHKVGFRTPSVAGAAVAFPGSTTSVASMVLQNGVMPTTPISGAVWRVDNHLYFNHNSTTKEVLTIPDNGQAGQMVVRNAANDDYEHKYPSSAFGKYHQVTNTDVSVADDDFTVVIYNQSTTRTMTLPDPVSFPNRVIIIGQATGNTNTITLSRTIYDGGTAIGAIINDNKFMIQSDGANWRVIMVRL